MIVAVPARHGALVCANCFVRRVRHAHLSAVNPDNALAKAADLVELMANENDGAASARYVAHLAQTLLLEIVIAHRRDFIYQQNLWLWGAPPPRTPDAHTSRWNNASLAFVSRNFSSSEKATISSNFRLMSFLVMPRMAPFK